MSKTRNAKTIIDNTNNVVVDNATKTRDDLIRALRDCNDRNESKRIRRRLRAMNHWGGRKFVTINDDDVRVDDVRVQQIAMMKQRERIERNRVAIDTNNV